MNTLNGTARGVVHAFESSIPFEGDSRRAGDAGLAGHTLSGTVAGEVLGENAAIVILLFVFRWVDGETLGSMGHLLVGNRLGSQQLERIDP